MENYESQAYQQPTNDNGNYMVSKLPNTTGALVLGILSIICCCSGVIGLVLGIIGLMLANKDIKLYQANPRQYTGIETTNTARILNIIGLVISALSLIYSIYSIMAVGGWDAYYETIQESVRQAQAAQQ